MHLTAWRVKINLLFGKLNFTIFMISPTQKLLAEVIYTREIYLSYFPARFLQNRKIKVLAK